MLNVAVVEDEAEERRKLKACLDYVAEQKHVCFSVAEFETADAFLMKYRPEYDIVFMDIEFPTGMDGMEAARQLRRIDKTVLLIFVTNMAQLAIQGYEVEALDFIVKPLNRAAFLLKMTRALGRTGTRQGRTIPVLADGETVRLHVDRIRYVSVDGHYVVYHSPEGVFSEYSTLAAAEKKLGDAAFCRCDRGCLVNLRYVSVIRTGLCVVDGEELAIARPRYGQFKQAYAEYLSGSFAGMRGEE